jgi:hypothetical protein
MSSAQQSTTATASSAPSAAKRPRAGTDPSVPSSLSIDPLDESLDGVMEIGFEDLRDLVHIQFGKLLPQHYPWDLKVLEEVPKLVSRAIQGKTPLENLVVRRFITAEVGDQLDLARALEKSFGKGSIPNMQSYPRGKLLTRVYARVGPETEIKRMPRLMGGPQDFQWKVVENRSFVLFAPILSIWPLPLYSVVWQFTVKKEFQKEKVLLALKDNLEDNYVGFFSRHVSHYLVGLGHRH